MSVDRVICKDCYAALRRSPGLSATEWERQVIAFQKEHERIAAALPFERYPAAIAQVSSHADYLSKQIAHCAAAIQSIEATINQEVLKLAAQAGERKTNADKRKADRARLQEEHPDYTRLCDEHLELLDQYRIATTRLEFFRNEFAIARVEAMQKLAASLSLIGSTGATILGDGN